MKLENPLGKSAIEPFAPAQRGDLKGKSLAILINGKEYSDVVLNRLAERLRARGEFGEIRFWDKGWPVMPAPFLDEIAREADVVVTGVGH